jgi:hypothetical protein
MKQPVKVVTKPTRKYPKTWDEFDKMIAEEMAKVGAKEAK